MKKKIKNIRKTIFIINGLGGVGKSFIGNLLSKKTKLPLFSVDIIKERIFDSKLHICNSKTPEESLTDINNASLDILKSIIYVLTKNNISFICEHIFPSNYAKFFNQIKTEFKYKIIFINVRATLKTQLKSQIDRNNNRHIGHEYNVSRKKRTIKKIKIKLRKTLRKFGRKAKKEKKNMEKYLEFNVNYNKIFFVNTTFQKKIKVNKKNIGAAKKLITYILNHI